ncbi:MAG: hypothetical protein AAGI28_09875 [Pseudomonadota bacterium]
MALRNELISASNPEIGDALFTTYDAIVEHYVLRKWKEAGLDAGHFVEAARRFLEFKLFGQATPVAAQLSNFTEKVLLEYLNGKGDVAYRMLIPRTLWSLYALRNKRSIGHLGAVPANEIDASLLLNGAKWVIAEILRLESTLDIEGTRKLVSEVISRQHAIIWKGDGVTKVLDGKMAAREKALVVLGLIGSMPENELRETVEYQNPTNFRKILKRLHTANLIAYSESNCQITPLGTEQAEELATRFASIS